MVHESNRSQNQVGDSGENGHPFPEQSGQSFRLKVYTLADICTTPTRPSNCIFDCERNYTTTSTWSDNPTNPLRHEVLQTQVKGYREETYWGEQHPIDEKVRDMSDYEFDRFVDEVEVNDADVYWGATY